ncbi:MAG: methionine synthase [Micromonosporaceae bacterium]|nr:methionine synthase [Micromonosporaceae bacterium]
MIEASWPWPAGAATGIGSLPGTDIAEAMRVVLGELPDLPHLPELPSRGPGADLIGRGAALLTALPVELYAARWQIAPRPGGDLRRALGYLERDLDTATDQASEFSGPFKIQVAGPWTLASVLNLPTGGVALRDPGAARDIAASLADGVRAHVAEVRARLPKASILLQIDEPALPAVLAGRIPTESGLGRLRAVEQVAARAALASVIDQAGAPAVVHCCAADAPFELIREAGAAGVSVDLGLLVDYDVVGQILDAGMGLIAGVVDTRKPAASGPMGSPGLGGEAATGAVVDGVLRFWHTLGFDRSVLSSQVVLSPACGLGGLAPERARAVLAICRDAARRLAEDEG